MIVRIRKIIIARKTVRIFGAKSNSNKDSKTLCQDETFIIARKTVRIFCAKSNSNKDSKSLCQDEKVI
jgi:hypothetical protein